MRLCAAPGRRDAALEQETGAPKGPRRARPALRCTAEQEVNVKKPVRELVWLAFIASAGSEVCAGEAPARLPEIVVSPLQEEQRVGPYGQPEWTTHRRFATTRVYLQQPPGCVAFEQWIRSRFLRGGGAKHRLQEEIEIGLPGRFQLDFYENWTLDQDARARQEGVAVELRWAMADWGRIPLNPTWYAEWKFMHEAPDACELKLLLGEQLCAGWHWGLNAVYEQEVDSPKTTEWAINQGVSRTLCDGRLSLGAEVKAVWETDEGSRSDPVEKYLLGPSLQWRPTARTHLDWVPLFGLNDEAPHVESYLIFGVDLGGPGAKQGREPVSLRSE